MKLKNKKTGEIGKLSVYTDGHVSVDNVVSPWSENTIKSYNSLAELNAEWEDYEEPAYYYFIQDDGRIGCDAIDPYNHKSKVEERKSIGNYFETKEEAEKAVEKLKAWKRLKDNGFTIRQWRHTPDMNLIRGSFINIKGFIPEVVKNMKDLDLLFGGEE